MPRAPCLSRTRGKLAVWHCSLKNLRVPLCEEGRAPGRVPAPFQQPGRIMSRSHPPTARCWQFPEAAPASTYVGPDPFVVSPCSVCQPLSFPPQFSGGLCSGEGCSLGKGTARIFSCVLPCPNPSQTTSCSVALQIYLAEENALCSHHPHPLIISTDV